VNLDLSKDEWPQTIDLIVFWDFWNDGRINGKKKKFMKNEIFFL